MPGSAMFDTEAYRWLLRIGWNCREGSKNKQTKYKFVEGSTREGRLSEWDFR